MIVLAVRLARPVVNLAARLAVRLEIEASIRTGMPPLASTLGARLVEELHREFRGGYHDATNHTTEGAHL